MCEFCGSGPVCVVCGRDDGADTALTKRVAFFRSMGETTERAASYAQAEQWYDSRCWQWDHRDPAGDTEAVASWLRVTTEQVFTGSDEYLIVVEEWRGWQWVPLAECYLIGEPHGNEARVLTAHTLVDLCPLVA